MGPALALEYRNVIVPIVSRHESEAAMDLACRLATERGASIVALHVIGVPLELPLEVEEGEGYRPLFSCAGSESYSWRP